MEASHKKHRPHIKVGKDAEEDLFIICTYFIYRIFIYYMSDK